MRQSELFTKTRREAPKDEEAKNAKLLIRAGFINKEMAGVYDFLPLGLRVLNKIENLIREEMNKIGGQELSLAALQGEKNWKDTERWELGEDDIWFKAKRRGEQFLGLAFTHEEPLTKILTSHVSSYKDLPLYIYQFQAKFRNELRSQSGVMRTLEFVMKDLYSFSSSEDEHNKFYERVKEAYRRIFDRVGIGESTYLTKALGGSFSAFSHEFQTVTEVGEDTIFITNEDKKEAVNKEVETPSGLKERRAVEVGNIFSLGTRFSEKLGLVFADKNGEKRPVIMGSYGIGLGRLMGTIVEVLSDEKGIVWPESVAPFQVHLLALGVGSDKRADQIYKTLSSKGIEVLYDDRDLRAGEKFADADLIGIPKQVLVGNKEPEMLEVQDRSTGENKKMSLEQLVRELTK
ncbi:MAG: aminoacyl--tRNA ligase-related protein [Minisyncoccia bacterium]